MDEGKVLHFQFAQPALDTPGNGTAPGAKPAGPATTTLRGPRPEKLMRLLSDRNLKLLRLIKTAEPKTLAELSRISGRPKASLTRTLARLSELGIVVLLKAKGRGKIPKVACDRVRLEVSLVPDTDHQ